MTPDTLCECGDPRRKHTLENGCTAIDYRGIGCDCLVFHKGPHDTVGPSLDRKKKTPWQKVDFTLPKSLPMLRRRSKAYRDFRDRIRLPKK